MSNYNEVSKEHRKQIDSMTHEKMCRRWRFGPVGDPLLQSEAGAYFRRIFKQKGGMTTQMSKKIGWER